MMKRPDELVRQFPFFAGLDEQTYEDILAYGKTRVYDKDELLFLQDEPCKGLFLVQAGVIKIFKLAENGREQILTLQHPGDAVAEVPLFDDGPYPASAAAFERSTLLFIAKADFQHLLDTHPQMSRSIITVLARRLRKLVGLVEDLSLRQLRERMGRFLLEEAKGRSTFHLKFTNDELAAHLGSVRDVISRTLSALQNDGLIRLRGRQVDILDADRLTDGR